MRLLVSVPFHRLWLYWQQIDGIVADSADYLRHIIWISLKLKKELPGAVIILGIFICFFLIIPPQNLYNGI